MGRMPAGAMLDEVNLATQYKVSRTPVREALRRLEQDSLVTTVPRRGTFVRRASLKDMLEIHQIRRLLEPAAARLAAALVDTDELAALEARIAALLADDTEMAKEAQPEAAFLQVDWQLHDLVLRSAGNNNLREMINSLRHRIGSVRRPYTAPRIRKSLQELQEIVAALRERDGARAEAAMNAHIASAIENWLKLLQVNALDPQQAQGGAYEAAIDI